MNSRDAAYDDEQLRRAIEASKEEGGQDVLDLLTRRAKRGRSDSEECVYSFVVVTYIGLGAMLTCSTGTTT